MRSLSLLSVLLVALAAGGARAEGAAAKLVYMALWRGCEEACQGFQERIAASGLEVEVVLRDAGQDKSVLPDFVEEARALDADLVVTWGTSVTLGMVGTLGETTADDHLLERPVVFMIVADPVGAGIVESYGKTGRPNVTGTRNRVPESVNVTTIRAYDPAFETLGMLYNTNEANSVLKVEEMEELSAAMDFELVALELPLGTDGLPRAEDIPGKVAALAERGVDFIYVGSSSFLDSERDLFTGAALEHGIPVLSPYERLVRDSEALISVAARYQDVGALAADQALKILVEDVEPGDLPVASVEQFAYVINMKVAAELDLYPPIEILQFAETVN